MKKLSWKCCKSPTCMCVHSQKMRKHQLELTNSCTCIPKKWKNSAGNVANHQFACTCIPKKCKNISWNWPINVYEYLRNEKNSAGNAANHQLACTCIPKKCKNIGWNWPINVHEYLRNEKTRPEMLQITNLHVHAYPKNAKTSARIDQFMYMNI